MTGMKLTFPEIVVAVSLRDKVRIEAALFENLICREESEEVWRLFSSLENKYGQKYKAPAEALEILRPARDLYKAIGIEPTKTRPSSEALFRRVVQKKGLFRINSIVDCGNYCSLKFLLPVGLYDAEKISGGVTLRVGKESEGYKGIGKDWINVAARFTLADKQGPFGNPSSDSARTRVTENTRRLLFVLFAPFNYSGPRLREQMESVINLMLRCHPEGNARILPVTKN